MSHPAILVFVFRCAMAFMLLLMGFAFIPPGESPASTLVGILALITVGWHLNALRAMWGESLRRQKESGK